MMRRLTAPLSILLILLKTATAAAQTGCGCTNCPQQMPDLFDGQFLINVAGAVNNDLAAPNQGVCGISITFDHEYIGDLEVTLTSPSGQTITLAGPIGLGDPTFFTTWDIDFVPCTDMAAPDGGFSDVFDNNQPWGNFGTYSGSYYPHDGCLEDFDTGPVNGTWTLEITDGLDQHIGNFLNYEIIFCDAAGISCFTCAANAGALAQPDMAACAAAPALDLNLPPTWAPASLQPPAASYSYTYIISQNAVIIEYDSLADLRNLPAGSYTVCGLSYLTADSLDLPAPNGSLTVAQLATQLNSGTPPFCGDITGNCVNVTIHPIPPNVHDTAVICFNTCYGYHGQQFCNTGIFPVNLTSPLGCPFTATLHLTELPLETEAVDEFICEGQCSATPGFATACTTGVFTKTFSNPVSGCDSVVTLNLTVIAVDAVIAPPAALCPNSTIVLSSTGSSAGPGVEYLWTGPGIAGAADGPTCTVNLPGDYRLFVKKTMGGTSCTDSTTATVAMAALPLQPIILGEDTACSSTPTVFSIQNPAGATGWAWSVPPGAAIASGQGTASITVDWSGSAGGPVCATPSNNCGDGPQACLNVVVLNLPLSPVIAGGSAACTNLLQTYSVQNQPGLAYNWSVSAAGTIQSGQGTNQISVLWAAPAAAGSVCLFTKNQCGDSPQACLAVALESPPAAPVLAPIAPVCAGESAVFTITAVPTATSYQWAPPPGATVTAGQGTTTATVLFSQAPGGPLCVAAANGCGPGPADCEAATVLAVPSPSAGADAQNCGLTFNLAGTQSLPNSSLGWSAIGGPGPTVFANPASAATQVTVNQYGSYLFELKETNGKCATADSVAIVFHESPAAGLIVPACLPGNLFYTISFPINGGQPAYSVPGGTVAASLFTSNPVANATAYSFTITDANGCQSPAISGNFDCTCTTFAGAMDLAQKEACEGLTIAATPPLNAVLDATDMAAFFLHDNPGTALGQVFDQNLTGIFSKTPAMAFGQTYYISYVVGNALPGGLPDPADGCRSVAQGTPAVWWQNPVTVAGADRDTCGTELTLAAQPSTGFGSWAVASGPVGGVLLFGDILDPLSGVTASKPGFYNASWSETNHGCLAADVVVLGFFEKPAAQNVALDCDATGENFTVGFDLAGAAPFFINNQQLAGASFVSPPFPSGATFLFEIKDSNGCTGDPVSGSKTCACLSAAGAMPTAQLTACAGDSIQAGQPTGAMPDGNDAGAFVLHDLGGAALGNVLGTNKTGKFGFVAGQMVFGQTYFVSYLVGNAGPGGLPNLMDNCLSVAAGQPVVFHPKPVADAGTDQFSCGTTVVFAGNQPGGGGSGAWSVASKPAGATAVLSNQNSPGGSATVSGTGLFLFEWTITENGCTGADTMAAGFGPPPSAVGIKKDCDGAATQFTLSFSINGGAGPFAVAGAAGAVAGNVFTSNPIASPGSYALTITDAKGCTAALSGSHDCNCLTDAGQMFPTPLVGCEGDTVEVAMFKNATLDSDDTLFFVLHDGAGAALGQVFFQSSEPKFVLQPPLVFGKTYFISPVATSLGAGGQPDLGDPCLSVAAGQPVVFHKKPSATLTALPDSVCEGQYAKLQFQSTGPMPLQVFWTDGAGGSFVINMGAGGAATADVMPAVSTTYKLLTIDNPNSAGCTALLDDSTRVTVGHRGDAGSLVVPPLSVCEGTELDVLLINRLGGTPDTGGFWEETSPVPSAPGAFSAAAGTLATEDLAPGFYTFKYTAPSEPPCPDATAGVVVRIEKRPAADAGPDLALDCFTGTGQLGGPGSATGADISYSWKKDGQAIALANEKVLTVGQPGDYELKVERSPLGCFSVDSIEVFLAEKPTELFTQTEAIPCTGQAAGAITATGAAGGTTPYLYSIDGGAFSSQNHWDGLAAGLYEIKVQDALGCELSKTVELTEAGSLSVDLGPDLTVTLGDSIDVFAEILGGQAALDTLIWSPLLNAAQAGTPLQSFRPLNSWLLTVKILDKSGCAASDQILIKVDALRNVYAPTAFRPGSGGENGLFQIFCGKDAVEVRSLQVFDRWGELVFEERAFLPNDPAIGWDGSRGGKKMAPAVFAWWAEILFADGETKTYKGDLTLVR